LEVVLQEALVDSLEARHPVVLLQFLDQLQVMVVVEVVITLGLAVLVDHQVVMVDLQNQQVLQQLRQLLLGKVMLVEQVRIVVVQTVSAMLVVEVVQEPLVLMVLLVIPV
tara:strand:+ start:330 stop:659 length:330 start_codon:yes stop_codon:yes gene_type:complete